MNQSENNSNTKTSTNNRVKSQKDSPRITLQELQKNTDELNRCKRNPVYFYNQYVRKEGQPVLTEEEYNKKVKAEFKIRDTVTPRQTMNIVREIDCIPPTQPKQLITTQEEYEGVIAKINVLIEKEKKKNEESEIESKTGIPRKMTQEEIDDINKLKDAST